MVRDLWCSVDSSIVEVKTQCNILYYVDDCFGQFDLDIKSNIPN